MRKSDDTIIYKAEVLLGNIKCTRCRQYIDSRSLLFMDLRSAGFEEFKGHRKCFLGSLAEQIQSIQERINDIENKKKSSRYDS